VDQLVVPLVKASTEAVKGFDFPVSLIFIDGAHDYESVKADFEAWFSKVMEGGIVAFHDTTNFEGPQILVRKALFRNPHIRGAAFVRSIAYGEKVNTIPAGAWLSNQFRLGLKFIHDPILNFANKPAVKRWIFPLLGRPLGKQPVLSGNLPADENKSM
jgi:hypothetical protein